MKPWRKLVYTPDEAMSGGLAKACVPGKKCSVPDKIEFLMVNFVFQDYFEKNLFPLIQLSKGEKVEGHILFHLTTTDGHSLPVMMCLEMDIDVLGF